MRISRLIVINSIFLTVLSACYEKQEGCLEVIATNFDFAADLPCDNCCEYPELRILVDHAMDTLAFKTGIPFEIGGGQVVQFEEIIYYFSKVAVSDVSNNIYTVEGSISVLDYKQNGMEIIIPDNFLRISYPKFNFPIGTFRNTGSFNSVLFDLGINGLIEPLDVGSDHPLFAGADSLYLGANEGYINARFVIQTDTAVEKLDTFLISGPELTESIELPLNVDFQGGEDLILEVRANYLKWFEGVDFLNQSQEEVIAKIKMNTTQVFSTF